MHKKLAYYATIWIPTKLYLKLRYWLVFKKRLDLCFDGEVKAMLVATKRRAASRIRPICQNVRCRRVCA